MIQDEFIMSEKSDLNEEVSGKNVVLEEGAAHEEALAKAQDRYIRALADLDNMRKRAHRERQHAVNEAQGKIFRALLPALDHFKMGLESASKENDMDQIRRGFEIVFEQMESTLIELGLERIDPEGEAFDPHRHECVAYESSDAVEEGYVMRVVRVGYALSGQSLIRPASVVVSKGAQAEEGEGA